MKHTAGNVCVFMYVECLSIHLYVCLLCLMSPTHIRKLLLICMYVYFYILVCVYVHT